MRGPLFKTANATILRGGKEAFHTNQIIVSIMRNTLDTRHYARCDSTRGGSRSRDGWRITTTT